MMPSARSTNASGNGANKPSSPAEYRKIKSQWANAQLLAEDEARQVALTSAAAAGVRGGRKHGAASEAELFEEMKKQDADKSQERSRGKENAFKRQHLGIVGLLGWLL